MNGRMKRPGQRPWLFFLGTFGWTWAFWWTAAASGQPWGHTTTILLHAIGGLGPVLVAALLVHRHGHAAQRDFWRRVRDPRRVSPRWWMVITALAVLPYLVGRLSGPADGPWLQLGALSFLVAGVAAGLVEEPGWRGYAQDALQRNHHVLTAAVIVGAAWALWHLPLFFVTRSFQNGLGPWSERFWLFMLALLAWAVTFAWVYLATGRSILAVVVLHALSNAAAESISVDGNERVETAVLLAMAVAAAVMIRRTARTAPATDRPPARRPGPGRRSPSCPS
jgi:uncharacterized protein